MDEKNWESAGDMNQRRVTFASTIEEKTISRLVSVNTSSCDGFSMEDSILEKEFDSKSFDLIELLQQISDTSQSLDKAETDLDQTPSFSAQPTPQKSKELKEASSTDTLVEEPKANADSGVLSASVLAPLEGNQANASALLDFDDKQLVREALSVDIVVDDKGIFTANARIAGVKTPLKGFPAGISLDLLEKAKDIEHEAASSNQQSSVDSGNSNGGTFSSILFPKEAPASANFVSDSQLNNTTTLSAVNSLAPKPASKATNRAAGPVLPSPGVFFGARSGNLGSLEAEDDTGVIVMSNSGRPLFATPATAVPTARPPKSAQKPPVPRDGLFESPAKAGDTKRATRALFSRPAVTRHPVRVVQLPQRSKPETAVSKPVRAPKQSNVLYSSAVSLPKRLSEISREALLGGPLVLQNPVPPSPKTHILLFGPVQLGSCLRKRVTIEMENAQSSSLASSATVWKIQSAGSCYIHKAGSVYGVAKAKQATKALDEIIRQPGGSFSDPAAVLAQQSGYLTLGSEQQSVFLFKTSMGRLDPSESKQSIQFIFRPVKTSGVFVQTFHILANQQLVILRALGIGFIG